MPFSSNRWLLGKAAPWVALLSFAVAAQAAPPRSNDPTVPAPTPTPAPPKTVPQYDLTDLGPMSPADDDSLPKITKDGAVCYWQFVDGKTVAALWRDGKTVALATLPPFAKGYATGINNNGKVIGVSKDISYPGASAATLWSGKAMAAARLPHVPDATPHPGSHEGRNTRALGINDKNVIVGSSELANSDIHAFIWADGVYKDLGTVAKGNYTFARAINKSGVIIGAGNVTDNGSNHALVWRKGVASDLGLLPGGTFSQATAINEHNVIVGWANDKAAEVEAIVWRDGKLVSLGDLGENPAAAWGLNNKGEIVGHSFITGKKYGPAHAFLWRDGLMMDLNYLVERQPGWLLQNAYDINDRGDIVGVGSLHGTKHFFVLHLLKK